MPTRFASFAVLAFLGLALAFPVSVFAEDKVDSGYYDAMVEFLTIQNAAKAIEDQMTYAIAQQTLGSIAASGIEISEPMQQIVVDVARTSIGSRFGELEYLAKLYTPLYAEHYSEAELRELTAFWRSPIGQKTIASMQTLTEGSARVLQEASISYLTDFQTAVDKRFEEAGIVLLTPQN